ncbi:MAG TPA: hypothetical protein VGR27_14275 [Longimicrobiaceae bacterium]|nr:hypothetical protein [Longimicrobiaceae bacterium]
MRTGDMGKLWLALVLLICALGSAPVGSMEQAPPESIGSVAHLHSHPAARPTGEYEMVERQAEPYHPRISWVPPGTTPFLHRSPSPSLAVGPVRLTGPPASSSYDYTPLCERLPYDATAPPTVA